MSLNFSSVSPGLTAIADGLGGALLAWKSYQTDTDPVDQGADVVALESSLLGAVQGLMSVTGELGDSFATGLNPVAVAGALINGAQASMQISAAAPPTKVRLIRSSIISICRLALTRPCRVTFC